MLTTLDSSILIQEGRRLGHRVYQGVYVTHLNFHWDIRHLIREEYPEFGIIPGHSGWLNSYGVCDHWTQLPLRRLEDDPRKLLVYLTPIVKALQPASHGWRWHKWGPYIGVHDIEGYEYLADTPDVAEVYVYHIVEVIDERSRS